jgi:sugar (pentulose or hexulose) kinase
MLYEESKSHISFNPRILIGSGNGLRKSEVWRNIFANEFDLDLVLPKHSEEAAVGACIFAATANGKYRNIREAQKTLLGGHNEF